MIAESNIVPQCIARAGTLGGLVTLYESNFIKLNQLFPLMGLVKLLAGREAASCIACSPRDLDLHLRIDDATRYTIDLRVTYWFPEDTLADGQVSAKFVAEPDLRLRAYLDARCVEVLGWAATPRHASLSRIAGEVSRELDRRWARNIMLGKWLEYLADRGYAFPPFVTAD